MKILRQNKKEGIVKLVPETLDDLWHLDNILEPGDMLTAKTYRKQTIRSGSETKEGDRIPVVLTIEVEKKDFHKDTHSLRVTGKVTAGPEDKVPLSSYHTISIEPRLMLTVQKKEWNRAHLERLKRSRNIKPLLLICVLDRESADIAELKESGIGYLATISSEKIMGRENQESYWNQIFAYLQRKSGHQAIVIAGPGFERENLLEYVKSRDSGLASRMVLEHANSTGRAGINEVVKSSANRILQDTRISREASFVDRLLEEIEKEGKAAYGPKETEEAVKSGAAETLLISEEKIRGLESLAKTAEKTGASVVIISSDHELGERFLHLGGVGALLRFKTK
jgi:protein pelota